MFNLWDKIPPFPARDQLEYPDKHWDTVKQHILTKTKHLKEKKTLCWAEKIMFFAITQKSRLDGLCKGEQEQGQRQEAGWTEDTWALTRDKMTGYMRQQYQARGPKPILKKKIQKTVRKPGGKNTSNPQEAS